MKCVTYTAEIKSLSKIHKIHSVTAGREQMRGKQ